MSATVVQTPTSVTYNGATVTAVSVSFAGPVLQGNAVVVVASIIGPSTLTSATDNQSGNTYTLLQAGGVSGTRLGLGYDTAVNASGTFTVSLNFSSVQIWGRVGAIEIFSIKDQTADATGTVSGVNVGTTDVSVSTSGSTTVANCFVLSAMATLGFNAKTITACATGYSLKYSDAETASFPSMGLAHKSVTSTGTQSAAWAHTNNGGLDGAGIIAAFEDLPAIEFFASARNPADQGAAVTPPCAVTPPANMLAGDFVVLHAGFRGTSVSDFSMSQQGGQTWSKAGEFDSTNNAKQATFWCRFNGTWSANPSVTNSTSTAMWVEMQVFRPSNSNNTWAVDQAYAGANFAAPSTPFTVTRTGVSNVQASTVTIATWLSQDDNTWGSLSGAGWATYSPIYSRVGTTASHAHAYRIGGSGATGNVSLNQATLGGDAGSTSIVSFYEQESSITGTGTLVAGSSSVTGSGESSSSGSGTLAAQVASVVGSGLSSSSGSGVLVAATSVVSGAGLVQWLATGALEAQASVIVGTGESISSGIGVLASADAVLVGIGEAVFPGVDGTGILVASGAVIEGVGLIQWLATGVLQPQDSTIDGTGISESAGTGALQAQDSIVIGVGEVVGVITGTGILQSGDAAIVGVGLSSSDGTGALQAQSSILVGFGVAGVPGATVVIFAGPNKGVSTAYHQGVSRPVVHLIALGGGNFDVTKTGGVSGDLAPGQVSAEGYLIDGELP